MSANATAVTEVVRAPAETVIAVLLDFESHPRWQSMTSSSRVLERDAAGRGVLVEEVLDAKVRAVRVVARYDYDLPRRLSWHQVEGDVKALRCAYTFTPRPDGSTLVGIELAFEVGFYVPGPIRGRIRDQALRSSLRELRVRAEQLAASP